MAIATHQPIALSDAAVIVLDDFAASADAALALAMTPCLAFWCELRLSVRQGGDIGLVLGFFVLAVLLFPFGVGPEPELLGRIAAGIIWVAALLASVLSLERLFAADHADGGLDLILLSPAPLELIVLAKGAAHWVTTGLPLVLISPVLAIFVDLDPAAIPVLTLGLLIGTPALSLLGAIAAALTLGARRPGILVSLLVLPLFCRC